MPICAVLELPARELDYWAVIWREEYFEQHPDERARWYRERGMTAAESEAEAEKLREFFAATRGRKRPEARAGR